MIYIISIMPRWRVHRPFSHRLPATEKNARGAATPRIIIYVGHVGAIYNIMLSYVLAARSIIWYIIILLLLFAFLSSSSRRQNYSPRTWCRRPTTTPELLNFRRDSRDRQTGKPRIHNIKWAIMCVCEKIDLTTHAHRCTITLYILHK
jgi:hypothetical protein